MRRCGSFFSQFPRFPIWLLAGGLAGCGSGDGGLANPDPRNNDLNVVAAFGDSITQGNRCACVPYPGRLSGLIGKTVANAGIHGTTARESVGRTVSVIGQNHPAFMLILYGVNDVIHGTESGRAVESLREMVGICRQNGVVPVLGTYPIPFGSHKVFAGGARSLNRGIRALASELRIPCVDLEVEFCETGNPADGSSVTDQSLMEEDGLHPNDAGTQIIAMAFADRF